MNTRIDLRLTLNGLWVALILPLSLSILSCEKKPNKTYVNNSPYDFGIEINCGELDRSKQVMTGITLRHFTRAEKGVVFKTGKRNISDDIRIPSSAIYRSEKLITRIDFEAIEEVNQMGIARFNIESNQKINLSIYEAREIILNDNEITGNSFPLNKGKHTIVLKFETQSKGTDKPSLPSDINSLEDEGE